MANAVVVIVLLGLIVGTVGTGIRVDVGGGVPVGGGVLGGGGVTVGGGGGVTVRVRVIVRVKVGVRVDMPTSGGVGVAVWNAIGVLDGV